MEQLSKAIVDNATLDKTKLSELASYAYARWKDAAEQALANEPDRSQRPWRSRDYRADYLAGMKKGVTKDGINFYLEGEKALAVEFGWGVPRSPDWNDGIGKYTGRTQDLRPWLLHPASPHVQEVESVKGVSRQGATRYRVLRFDAPKLSTIIEQTVDQDINTWSENQRNTTGATPTPPMLKKFREDQKKRYTHTARSLIDTDDQGNLIFKPLPFYAEAAENPYTRGKHSKWVYAGAVPAGHHGMGGADTPNNRRIFKNYLMQKAQFNVYRTITDSERQIAAGIFFTKGIKPVRLFKELQKFVREGLSNLLAGLRADGGAR